jgi:hypothetical protein
MKRVVVLAIVISLLFCLLGGIAGYFLAPPGSGWVRLAEPPSKAVHITFIGGLIVRVQTQDGQLY